MQVGRGRFVFEEDTVKNVNCPCPGCGAGLAAVLAWMRILIEPPVELPYRGPWGLKTTWEVGGAEVLDVVCPRCGHPVSVGRHCPVASA